MPKQEFFQLFITENSEMGIFLDISYKIYQNGNYKREVIEMMRMEYLQKLLDWKDEKVIKVITGRSDAVANPHYYYNIRSI